MGNMSMCEALAWQTEKIAFATSIVPIYQRTMIDFCQSAAMMHEVSGGRFSLGIGIAHGPSYVRMGVTPGKPLADTSAFIEKFRAETSFGPLPPIIVAALRKKMVALAGELAEGVVFANVCRSHMHESLSGLRAAKRKDGFFIGNMIPTCISDDVAAAKEVNRRTLTRYASLPNYRNYWKEAGYVEEMTAIEKALAEGRPDDVPKYLTDKWLADNTLFGPVAQVREGVAAWRAAGVHTPILVPTSAAGNQMKAIDEVFAAFS
jgi:alkanesulfonate monooxygenase SsuD/methylene tetrahydromethanopterin reductase-like flavin-dependent oxidoreductase (luciferase family)